MVSEAIKADTAFPELFQNVLRKKMECLNSMKESIKSIYSEFTRKLYNTRLAELLDCYRQTQAAMKGSATLSGQISEILYSLNMQT